MEQEINQISEDLAQTLIETFEDFNKANEELEKTLKNFLPKMEKEIQLKVAEKFVYYIDKYSQASFFTRWYWLRKAKRFIHGINDINDIFEDGTVNLHHTGAIQETN